jgi:hypothetical protein
MTRIQVSAIALAFTTFLTGHAMAASDAPVTRAQVQAELTEAIRTGNIIVGESGDRLNEIMPNNYAAGRNVISKSRAQVQSELAEAIASGELRRHIEA